MPETRQQKNPQKNSHIICNFRLLFFPILIDQDR